MNNTDLAEHLRRLAYDLEHSTTTGLFSLRVDVEKDMHGVVNRTVTFKETYFENTDAGRCVPD